jgi:hypothetical protein
MKIKELIEILKKHKNQDAEVMLWRWFPNEKPEVNFLNISLKHDENTFYFLEPENIWYPQEKYSKERNKYNQIMEDVKLTTLNSPMSETEKQRLINQ